MNSLTDGWRTKDGRKLLRGYRTVWVLLLISYGVQAQASGAHPRGILGEKDVITLREKIQHAPFRAMYENLVRVAQRQQRAQATRSYEPYADSDLLENQAYLYLLTGDQTWAEGAWRSAERILTDSVYFLDPLSRGLTRAKLLQKMAIAYDFCYAGWSELQRTRVNDQLFRVMFSVSANMGHEANYAIESNWMGVRYGSVLLTTYVWDRPLASHDRPAELPLRWDATKRLQDHLKAVIFANGWNGESMSYHAYGWTFIGPALLAMKQNMRNFDLASYAPEVVNTLHALMTSTVAIEQKEDGRGMQADLADDDLMFSTEGLLGMAFRLYPPEQHAALKWMHDYLIPPEGYAAAADNHLWYSLLYYPDTLASQNPAEIGWLTYHDPEQGIVVTRNRFQDENDIVATYNARATRIRGHRGPDTNTFRLIGTGVPWVIGGGRTHLTAGQSAFFPSPEETAVEDNQHLGTLNRYRFFPNGRGGFALGSGNCVGTENHQRLVYTAFDRASRAQAVMVVVDSSANGRRWRINTPEFNRVEEHADGYTLVAPNGSSMRVQFLAASLPVRLANGRVPYGGKTTRHNQGIWYQNKQYTHSRYLDYRNQGTVVAVITLQPPGENHPKAVLEASGNSVVVGDLEITLPWFQDSQESR